MIFRNYATFLPTGNFLWSRSDMVIPVAIVGGSGSTGVRDTSGGVYPTGVSATVGMGFFAPQSMVSSFDHLVSFHAGFGSTAADVAFGVAVVVVAGFAGVAVVAPPDTAA